MTEPRFLTLDEVLHLHELSLSKWGGSGGIRDSGGLESAVMQPMNDFYYAGVDHFGIAAAYAFHIAEAQAFIDGNKRTAISSALAFLELNGVQTCAQPDALYDAMIGIARHEMDKTGLAAVLRRLFS